MFRYMAFLWDSRERGQAEIVHGLVQRLRRVSPEWRVALSRDGARVLCADSKAGFYEPHVLPNAAGVVLGMLFEKRGDLANDGASSAVHVAKHSAAILASRGRWLTENGWGDYVAVIGDSLASSIYIIKDPTGALPCYATRFRGLQLVFSCIGDCAELGIQFAVESSYLRRRLIGGCASRQQALIGVSQVHPGECVEISFEGGAGTTRTFYWNPRTFVEGAEPIEEPDAAADFLRATVRGCTSTWAAPHASVLHRLSGGLDSSIVAGCLAAARARLTSYTYFNPHGRCDERPWARLAAAHAGGEHVETPVTPADIDLASMLRAPTSVEPVSLMSCILRTTMERPLAHQCDASAVFTGDGGDSGFCSESVAYAVQEYLRRRGLRPGVLELAARVALQTHRSAWSVLARALRAHLLRRSAPLRREMFAGVLQLIAADVREEFSTDLLCAHPWFEDEDAPPWSIILRLGALLSASDFYHAAVEPSESCPPVISPLYSQPVTELCLRIPIYTHFEHGRDRGLARRAFAGEAPAAIRERVWKDRAPGFHDELVSRNRRFLRATLFDGVLAAEGLLDRAAVGRALSDSAVTSTVSCVEILRHTELELWARQWTRSTAQRAAA